MIPLACTERDDSLKKVCPVCREATSKQVRGALEVDLNMLARNSSLTLLCYETLPARTSLISAAPKTKSFS